MNSKIWKTEKGSEIYQIRLRTNNVFLIRKDSTNILVDSGPKNTYNDLIKFINQLKDKPDKIDWLIITHAHYDHCMNAAKIKNQFGSRVICAQPESHYLQSGYRPLPKGTMWFTKFLIGFSMTAPDGYIRSKFSYEPVFPDKEINGPYLIPMNGNRVELINTPGHTDGSLSVIVDDEIALVGDAAFGLSKKSIFPPFADDSNQLKESWGVLLKTKCRVFIPAHGKPISRNRLEDEYEKFLQ